uniref:Uncharacterized protein n=1 Tax=Ditylenchus dipsaci TaxID=166011 RepID=A0A915DCJ4_9BILA
MPPELLFGLFGRPSRRLRTLQLNLGVLQFHDLGPVVNTTAKNIERVEDALDRMSSTINQISIMIVGALVELAIVAYNDKMVDQKQRTRRLSSIGNILARASMSAGSLPGLTADIHNSRRETTLLNYDPRELCRKAGRVSSCGVEDNEVSFLPETNSNNNYHCPSASQPSPKWKRMIKKSEFGSAIDQVSSIAFPVAFALFNLVYWTYYLSSYSTSNALREHS